MSLKERAWTKEEMALLREFYPLSSKKVILKRLPKLPAHIVTNRPKTIARITVAKKLGIIVKARPHEGRVSPISIMLSLV